MNCRDFQNQFEVDSDLNREAKKHLSGCENCREFERNEIRLTQIIQSLPKAEAPKDFAFRLNSYIAKTEKIKKPLPAVWQTLRFATPFAAAVLIFGFIIINSNLFTSENQPAVAEKNKLELIEDSKKKLPKTGSQETLIAEREEANLSFDPAEPVINSEFQGNEIQEVKSAPKETIKSKEIKNTNSSAVKKNIKPTEKDFSGSKKFASTQPDVLVPLNSGQNADAQIKADVVDKRKILQAIGISTVDANWTVNSVKKDSAAEKSGIKAGDVVLEINELPVSAQISQNENIEIKSLKILRSNKILKINLVN